MGKAKESDSEFFGRLQRGAGPLAPFLGVFAGHLLEAGYSGQTITRSLLLAGRFAQWILNNGFQLQVLDLNHVEQFLVHRRECGWIEQSGASASLRRFLAFLRTQVSLSTPAQATPINIDKLLLVYSHYLTQERGIGSGWLAE